MATYAIGDVQGCFDALQRLLEHIQFNSAQDTLWFTGDLVNRGPKSLETLRLIKNLGPKHKTVLGNHDLHLLAVAHNVERYNKDDTFQSILQASDRDELITWLRMQPLLHHDDPLGFTLVHAGLAPSWDLPTAKHLANEVENILKSEERFEFFKHMYGNKPDFWDPSLRGYDRLRCITNYFTRARFCYSDGRLELSNKGTLENHPEFLHPWFALPRRENAHLKIIFGHWAALGGVTDTKNVYAIDTGCVWGFNLTAFRLDDQKRFCVNCQN